LALFQGRRCGHKDDPSTNFFEWEIVGMLKREQDKLAFQNMDPSQDPLKLLRMTGFNTLDDATLLGALLDLKAHLRKEGVMEDLHNKGREALRVLAERKMK
jgi:hypothetical protein